MRFLPVLLLLGITIGFHWPAWATAAMKGAQATAKPTTRKAPALKPVGRSTAKPSASKPVAVPFRLIAAPPLGGTISTGEPMVIAAAGQTATLALIVQGPRGRFSSLGQAQAGRSVEVSLAGDFVSSKGRISKARVTLRPVADCAPYAPPPAVTLPDEGADGSASRAPSSSTSATSPQTFWLQVRLPRGQPPGLYRGVVRLTAGSGATAARVEAPVLIEVLPFDLMGASRQFVFLGRSAWNSGAGLVPTLKEIGFLTLGVAGGEAALWSALDACRTHAVRSPIPCRPPEGDLFARATQLAAACRERGLPPLLWLAEVDQLATAAALSARGEAVGALLGPADPLPDLPIDTIIRRVDASVVAAYLKAPLMPIKPPAPGEPPARRLVQWWSWDAAVATPAQNRLFAGFLLWRSGFTGACVEEGEADGADRAALALRWEALRTGVDDVRYLTTYYALLRQLRDKDRRHPLPDRAEAAVGTALARLTPDSPISAADACRRELVRWIAQLRAVVGG